MLCNSKPRFNLNDITSILESKLIINFFLIVIIDIEKIKKIFLQTCTFVLL